MKTETGFKKAYKNLVLNSERILISDCKTVEVFITGEPTEPNALLTIAYTEKEEFFTKVRKEDPEKFEEAYNSFIKG
jgi:hypothetical protein